jgi:hypothetical protein
MNRHCVFEAHRHSVRRVAGRHRLVARATRAGTPPSPIFMTEVHVLHVRHDAWLALGETESTAD